MLLGQLSYLGLPDPIDENKTGNCTVPFHIIKKTPGDLVPVDKPDMYFFALTIDC